MQEYPVFVLFDAYGDFEQREDNGLGLSVASDGVLQTELAQLLVQHVSCRRSQQTTKVGDESLSRVRSAFRSHFTCLIKPSLPRCAINLLVKRAGDGRAAWSHEALVVLVGRTTAAGRTSALSTTRKTCGQTAALLELTEHTHCRNSRPQALSSQRSMQRKMPARVPHQAFSFA